ncbi:MAG: hypothetical protein LBR07_02765 [Puniceicoccales bacterium]|jgi:hypothetical protein|nr:hypothetical protein [Puniceicoccales bacterium]
MSTHEHTAGGTPDVIDNGDYFTSAGFTGRIYKSVGGHTLTPDEAATLMSGGEITITDGKTRDGRPFRSAPTARWDPNAQPRPKVVLTFPDSPRTGTGDTGKTTGGGPTGVTATLPDGASGEITDAGDYYTVECVKKADGWPVRFYKQVAGRDLSPDDLKQILAAGEQGAPFEGFVSKKSGRAFSARLWFNPKKEPYPGLAFLFEDRAAG